MPFFPPPGITPFPVSGLDWADGITVPVGTPTPTDALIYQISPYNDPVAESFFEELPDSPEVDIGEVGTIAHRFRCDWETGKQIALGMPRGSLLSDTSGVLSSLLNMRLQRMRGNTAILTMTAEAVLDPPPDEYEVTPVEFNLALEKHPRYRDVLTYNLDELGGIIDELSPTGYEIVQNIKLSAVSPELLYRTGNLTWLNEDNIPGFDSVMSIPGVTLGQLIFELLDRFWRNETEFYLTGWQVHYSFYYFGFGQLGGPGVQALLPMDEGGYIQDPVTSGFLPPYFWSLDGTLDSSPSNNALQKLPYADALALYGNPANGIFKWLKQADSLNYHRIWFRQTLSWVGAPLGTWDAAVYPFWNGSGLSWTS